MERLTGRDEKGNLTVEGKEVYAGYLHNAASYLEEYEDALKEDGVSEAFLEDCKRVAQKYKKDNDGWISVEERLPECEKEVFIQTESGERTTAIYEDGTIREEDSVWVWSELDGEWDEERDCMIIPEGWWEYRHFNPDYVYNNIIDEKVIAWRHLSEPYRPERSGNEE